MVSGKECLGLWADREGISKPNPFKGLGPLSGKGICSFMANFCRRPTRNLTCYRSLCNRDNICTSKFFWLIIFFFPPPTRDRAFNHPFHLCVAYHGPKISRGPPFGIHDEWNNVRSFDRNISRVFSFLEFFFFLT